MLVVVLTSLWRRMRCTRWASMPARSSKVAVVCRRSWNHTWRSMRLGVIHYTNCGMETFTDEIMRDLCAHSLKTAKLDDEGWRDVGEGPGSDEARYVDWLTIDDREEAVVQDVLRIRDTRSCRVTSRSTASSMMWRVVDWSSYRRRHASAEAIVPSKTGPRHRPMIRRRTRSREGPRTSASLQRGDVTGRHSTGEGRWRGARLRPPRRRPSPGAPRCLAVEFDAVRQRRDGLRRVAPWWVESNVRPDPLDEARLGVVKWPGSRVVEGAAWRRGRTSVASR